MKFTNSDVIEDTLSELIKRVLWVKSAKTTMKNSPTPSVSVLWFLYINFSYLCLLNSFQWSLAITSSYHSYPFYLYEVKNCMDVVTIRR